MSELRSGLPECALVTGASSGIGRAAALHLASRGVNLVVAARRREPLAEVVEACEALGVGAELLAFDLTDEVQTKAAVNRLGDFAERLGPLEGLVNNAGAVVVQPVEQSVFEGEEDVYAEQLRVNFHGPRRLTEALLPGMLERGRGAIVNVASAAALRPFPGIGAYSVAKHALLGWTRALALELGGRGIGCAALCPYYVEGEMLERAVRGVAVEQGLSLDAVRAEFAGRNPGGALVSLDQTSAAIEALLGAKANGRVTVLDGGGLRDWNARLDTLDADA